MIIQVCITPHIKTINTPHTSIITDNSAEATALSNMFGESLNDIKLTQPTSKAHRIPTTSKLTHEKELTLVGINRLDKIEAHNAPYVNSNHQITKGNVVITGSKPKSNVYKNHTHVNCRLPGISGHVINAMNVDKFIAEWALKNDKKAPTKDAVIAYVCGMLAKCYYDQCEGGLDKSEISLGYKRMLRADKSVIDCGDVLLMSAGILLEDPTYRFTNEEGYQVRSYKLSEKFIDKKYTIGQVFLKGIKPSIMLGDKFTKKNNKNVISKDSKNTSIEEAKDHKVCHGHKKSCNESLLCAGNIKFECAYERQKHYLMQMSEEELYEHTKSMVNNMVWGATFRRKQRERSKQKFGW